MSLDQEKAQKLLDILATLNRATYNHAEAVQQERGASAHRIQCLNDLNKAQQEFDKLTEDMRKGSSMESDWGRR